MPEPAATSTVATPDGGRFDELALGYDARAGLPATAGAAVAQAIVDGAGLQAATEH